MKNEKKHVSGNGLALVQSLFKSNRYFDNNVTSQLPILSTSISPEKEQLTAFNQVVGWQNINRLAPTWLQVAAMPLYMGIITDKSFPYSPLGLVHVENRVTLFKALETNKKYDLNCYADNFRAHRKGQLFDLIVKARVDGELVYESVASNLAFLKHPPAAPDSSFAYEGALSNQLAEFQLATDTGRKYAAVSGDYNLIHLAALPAKLFGFQRHIAHGMYLKAIALSALQQSGYFFDQNFEVGIRFIKPVFLPGKALLFAVSQADKTQFSLESPDRKIMHSTGYITKASNE